MIVIICAKYKKNWSRTVEAIKRTRFSKSRPNDLEDIGQGQRSSHATPSHAIDHLYQIWKESILNCRRQWQRRKLTKNNKSKEDKVKVTNLKNSPKFQIFDFWNGHYTRPTFWSCLIRCASMKWIRWVLLKIQSGHDSVHIRTDGQGDTSIPPFQLRWSGGYNYNVEEVGLIFSISGKPIDHFNRIKVDNRQLLRV